MSTNPKPACPQKAPYAIAVEAGQKVSWCTCGLSQKQPFCDGAHKGSEFKPLHYVAESAQTLYLCGCKQTHNAPMCDGTHSKIPS